jgi:hypothetical protein
MCSQPDRSARNTLLTCSYFSHTISSFHSYVWPFRNDVAYFRKFYELNFISSVARQRGLTVYDTDWKLDRCVLQPASWFHIIAYKNNHPSAPAPVRGVSQACDVMRTTSKSGEGLSDETGCIAETYGRVYICHIRQGIHLSYTSGYTFVIYVRVYICHIRQGIHLSYTAGYTCVIPDRCVSIYL